MREITIDGAQFFLVALINDFLAFDGRVIEISATWLGLTFCYSGIFLWVISEFLIVLIDLFYIFKGIDSKLNTVKCVRLFVVSMNIATFAGSVYCDKL